MNINHQMYMEPHYTREEKIYKISNIDGDDDVYD